MSKQSIRTRDGDGRPPANWPRTCVIKRRWRDSGQPVPTAKAPCRSGVLFFFSLSLSSCQHSRTGPARDHVDLQWREPAPTTQQSDEQKTGVQGRLFPHRLKKWRVRFACRHRKATLLCPSPSLVEPDRLGCYPSSPTGRLVKLH